jgi:hypothetical protein
MKTAAQSALNCLPNLLGILHGLKQGQMPTLCPDAKKLSDF